MLFLSSSSSQILPNYPTVCPFFLSSKKFKTHKHNQKLEYKDNTNKKNTHKKIHEIKITIGFGLFCPSTFEHKTSHNL